MKVLAVSLALLIRSDARAAHADDGSQSSGHGPGASIASTVQMPLPLRDGAR
jgi:hypothetical protein